MNRRVAIQSGVLAGLGSTALAVAPSQAADAQEGDQRAVAAALHDIDSTLQQQAENLNAHWQVVRRVQEQQRTFLKSSHHYPEFIEVATLRPIQEDPDLAKTGDNKKGVIIGELTLKVKNEAALGVVADVFGLTASS